MRLKSVFIPNLFIFYEETHLTATAHLFKNPYTLFTVAKKQKRFSSSAFVFSLLS